MTKETPMIVRSHSQEREWLLHLGQGNLVAGVQQLIRQAQGKQEASPRKNKKSK